MTTYTKFIHLVEGSWLLENAADVLSSRGQIYRLRSTCQKKLKWRVCFEVRAKGFK